MKVTLREYRYILPDDVAVGSPSDERDCACIPRSAFNYLDRLLARDEARANSDDHAFFLRRTSWQGKHAFQVRNYVGVLQTRCGTQIEILPKTGVEKKQGSDMLVAMLRRLRNSPFRLGGDAVLHKAPMHLMEVFIGYFLREVNRLVKRGIRSDYVTREENLQFLKGRLLVGRHVRVNAVQQQRFYCAYDEFLPDRAENRLIHLALHKVMRLARAEENQRLCRELLFIFQDVPPSRHVARDFSLSRFNRATVHYRHAMEWCRMILEEESSVPKPGRTETISLLFPMERVFENYVGWMLSRADEVSSLRLQASGEHLIEAPEKIFCMKPDFVFFLQNQDKYVGDAKWKLIDSKADEKRCGVSQADLYQLYAYGKKYNAGHLLLFYPKTEHFSAPIEWRFENEMAIRLVPVPLPSSVESASLTQEFSKMIYGASCQ